MSTVTGYLSGVSPSLLAFLVFGTTKAFQRKMYRTFVPRFLRKQNDNLTSLNSSQLPFSTQNSSYARASTVIAPQTPKQYRSSLSVVTAPPHTPRHYHSNPSIRSSSEAVSFAPVTPKTPRAPPREPLRHFRSDSSIRKPEPVIEEEPPSVNLKPIYEPTAAWLEDESPPESLRRSQIGVAISAPSSPANAATTSWRGPTFLRDVDEESTKSAENGQGDDDGGPAAPVQLSIPLSRFNGNGAGSKGHRRILSETGSFTQIWSEGSRPSGSNQGSSSTRLALGQTMRPGREYSRYVAPVRRGSAV